MRTLIAALLVSTACWVSSPTTSFAQTAGSDPCADVLRIGLVDSYSLARSSNIVSATKDFVCDTTSNEALKRTDVGASIPIPELSAIVGANYDATRVDNWRHDHCSANSSLFAEADAINVAKTVLSPFAKDAMAAWSSCRVGTNGLSARIGDYAATDKDFTITLDWQPTKAHRDRPNIDSLIVTHAVCDNAPRQGTQFPDMIVLCHRSDDQRTMVIVNTSDGPVLPTPTLPAISKAPPPPPDCVRQPCKQFTLKVAKTADLGVSSGVAEAVFPLLSPAGALKFAPGKATVQGTVELTVNASTATWSNSPYRFEVKLDLGNQTVFTQVFEDGNQARSAQRHFTFTIPPVSADVAKNGSLPIAVRVGGNWTTRKETGNVSDRVNVDSSNVAIDIAGP